MKVVSPGSTHTVSFIPRFYPVGTIVVSLYNESDKTTTTPANTYYIKSGTMTARFTYTFVNKDKFQLKVTEGANVVFRGKLLCTDQTTQDYKITDGYYEYS